VIEKVFKNARRAVCARQSQPQPGLASRDRMVILRLAGTALARLAAERG